MAKSEIISTDKYFHPLDVVRFVCAFMVMLSHTYGSYNADTPYNLVKNLSFGVEIFFLMSGFLITYLLITEKEATKKVDLKRFYFKRILRIFPLYYFSVLMGPVVHNLFGENEPNYIYQTFFLGNYEFIKYGWVSTAVNHLWSICIEEHFYIVWPILIYFIPVKKLPWVFFGFIIVSAIFRGYTFLTEQWGGYSTLFFHTISRWDTLAIGSILAYAYYHKSFSLKTTFAQRLPLYIIFTSTFILVTFLKWDTLFLAVFAKYLYLAIPAFAIGNLLFNSNSIIKLKTPGVLHYLGKISYGLYMYHPFVILILLTGFKLKVNLFLIVPVAIITILISMFSYHFFEKPILSLKSKFFITKSSPVIEEKEIVNA